MIWEDSFYKALIAAWVGKQLGSYACFFLGRWGSQKIERRVTRTVSSLPRPSVKEIKSNKASLMLEATKRVFKQKPHALTFLSCAAAVPAWIKNYGLSTIPDVHFMKHFAPWCGFCGAFYSCANVLVGMSVGSGGDDDAEEAEKGSGGKVLMGVMAGVTFAFVVVLSYYAKKELEVQLKELDEEERISMKKVDADEIERNGTAKSVTSMV